MYINIDIIIFNQSIYNNVIDAREHRFAKILKLLSAVFQIVRDEH